jgi:hypothetical protein
MGSINVDFVDLDTVDLAKEREIVTVRNVNLKPAVA